MVSPAIMIVREQKNATLNSGHAFCLGGGFGSNFGKLERYHEVR